VSPRSPDADANARVPIWHVMQDGLIVWPLRVLRCAPISEERAKNDEGRALGGEKLLIAIRERAWASIFSLASQVIVLALLGTSTDPAHAQTGAAAEQPSADAQDAGGATADAPAQRFLVNEYRIEGITLLPQIEVEEAVYPFLGEDRTADDVEKARAALEQAYFSKGYQTVGVAIPPQQVTDGVVVLQVTESKIGRLRVKGSRYFSLEQIKEQASSLAEGTVPNFNDVTKDIVTLNQIPDRRITPTLRAGVAPGTVDVDLNVDDTLPFHGNAELNNRYSKDTTKLRFNASARYDNLWQLGHSLSVSYQVAPENPDDAQVFSGSYLARITDIPWLSFLVYGVKQDSDVATLGGVNVAGRGEIIGGRALFTLPSEQGFFHTLSAGIDYKHFTEGVTLGGDKLDIPITYYPLTASYGATWQSDGALTQLNTGVTFHFRGLGSNPQEFDAKRFEADGSFIYFRGDLAHTHDLPDDLQLYGKLLGQLASGPLVSSEQFSGGGLDTVRGYLESEALGDNGVIGSIELRSPPLLGVLGLASEAPFINEWRAYVFAEGGTLSINEPLPEQDSRFTLASIGLGSRVRLVDYLNGSIDLGFPLRSQTDTRAHDPRLTFRLWGEF
jgi:hemolysin activation/secretion protein